MRIVLDTNVLVAGLLSESGPPGWIVDLVLAGDLETAFDNRMMAEYRAVFARTEIGFARELAETVLEAMQTFGWPVTATPWPIPLPDPDDEPFLAVARMSGARCLITGNLKHFPQQSRLDVCVLSPRAFLEQFHQLKNGP